MIPEVYEVICYVKVNGGGINECTVLQLLFVELNKTELEIYAILYYVKYYK